MAMMKRTPKVRMGGAGAALNRFETTWNKAARGKRAPAVTGKTRSQGSRSRENPIRSKP